MQPTAYKWAWPALALAYVLGLFMVTIMDVDSAQYASISQEMLQSGEWLQVHHKGKDYLDKPPLLFWSSALFYAVFGVSQWAFRLPSVLSSIMGFWATYQLAKELYNKQTGQLAALILASTQAWLMFNHDVRTDTLISNFSILGHLAVGEVRKWGPTQAFVLGFCGGGLCHDGQGAIGGGGSWRRYWLLSFGAEKLEDALPLAVAARCTYCLAGFGAYAVWALSAVSRLGGDLFLFLEAKFWPYHWRK